MWFFKEKIVKKIPHNACWGCLVSKHKMDVNTLEDQMRCVTKKGVVDQQNVTHMRIFNHQDVEKKGVSVTGWETFDSHPDLVTFEGYVIEARNEAVLERKNH